MANPALQYDINFNTGAARAALLTFAAAVTATTAAIGVAFKNGLNANAELESMNLGIKGIIASLQDVRDASGAPAEGMERLAIAGEEAERQLKLLRVAGMQTSAEFKDLAAAFQTALGAGSSAGLGVDDIRELTVSLTIAAGAFNLAGDQLSSEIRAMLSGEQIDNSQIAQGLGITGAQIKLWREQGTLVENLNERLKNFKLLGEESGRSWSATLSNLQDGVTLFMQQTTSTAFNNLKNSLQSALATIIDPDTGEIAESFNGLADLADRVFTGVGDSLAWMLEGILSAAVSLSKWLDDNRGLVDAIFDGLGSVFDVLGDIVKQTFDFGGQLDSVLPTADTLTTIFQHLGVVLAGVYDVGKGFFATLKMIAAFMQLQMLSSIGTMAAAMDKVFGTDASAFINKLKRQTLAVGDAAIVEIGEAIDFTEARKAFVAVKLRQMELPRPSFSERQRSKREAEEKAGGGTVQPPPPPKPDPDKPNGAASRAAREAERAAAAALKEAEQFAEALAASLETILGAEMAASKEAFEARQSLARAELDKLVQLRLVSKKDELAQAQALDAADLAREKEDAQAVIQVLRDKLAAAKDAVASNEIYAELIAAEAALDTLLQREKVLAIEVEMDTAALARQIDEMKEGLRSEIEGLMGQSALGAIERSRSRMLSDPLVRSDPELSSLVNQKFDLDAQRAKFDDARNLFQDAQADLADAEQQLQASYARGAITGMQLEEELFELRKANLGALREQHAAMLAIAQASGDRGLETQARDALRAIDELNDSLTENATLANRAIADGIAQTMKAIVLDVDNATDAIKKSFASLLQSLADRYLNQLADQIFVALQGGGGGGAWGGAMGWLGSLAGGLFGGGREHGGPVAGGTAYVVGEVGPELFFPGSGGRVVSNADIMKALSLSVPRASMPSMSVPENGFGEGLGGPTSVTANVNPTVVVSTAKMVAGLRNEPTMEGLVCDIVMRSKARLGLAGPH